jgi:hypothetical protein
VAGGAAADGAAHSRPPAVGHDGSQATSTGCRCAFEPGNISGSPCPARLSHSATSTTTQRAHPSACLHPGDRRRSCDRVHHPFGVAARGASEARRAERTGARGGFFWLDRALCMCALPVLVPGCRAGAAVGRPPVGRNYPFVTAWRYCVRSCNTGPVRSRLLPAIVASFHEQGH